MYTYVCVLSTNNYLEGVLVLNENLKRLNSKYPLLCIINETITEESKNILTKFNIKYKQLNKINYDIENIKFSHWKNTFDKLNIFSLIEYEKIVYLDLDFLILSNLDHLFGIDNFSMVSDCQDEKKYYCSALMIIKPNLKDYNNLIEICMNNLKNQIADIGDQDIINEYFKDINVLDIKYNCIRGIQDEKLSVYDDIFNRYMEKRKMRYCYYSPTPVIIHYYGKTKPFMLNEYFEDEYCYLYFYYLNIIRKQKRELN